MCLSIPGKLTSIIAQLDDTFRIGKVSFGGIMREVNLAMVPEAKIGDYVLVHVGYALTRLDPEEAEKTLALFVELGEAALLETDAGRA